MLPFVSRIEFIHSKLTFFSAHVTRVMWTCLMCWLLIPPPASGRYQSVLSVLSNRLEAGQNYAVSLDVRYAVRDRTAFAVFKWFAIPASVAGRTGSNLLQAAVSSSGWCSGGADTWSGMYCPHCSNLLQSSPNCSESRVKCPICARFLNAHTLCENRFRREINTYRAKPTARWKSPVLYLLVAATDSVLGVF